MSEVISFQDGKAVRYAKAVIMGFLGDPPDTDFQVGYLAAMLDFYREGLELDGDDRIKLAERILNGDPDYHDSWHDIVGYAKLVADRLA